MAESEGKTASRSCLPGWWKAWKQRQIYNRDTVTSSIADATWDKLDREIEALVARLSSSGVTTEELRRAVVVARDGEIYYTLARGQFDPPDNFPYTLNGTEKESLVAERERLFSQGKMFRVILTVSLCSFLQGFVQSSINSATLYASHLKVRYITNEDDIDAHDWALGAMNCSPYLAAAFIGAPLSLAMNQWVGRRGAITISALLIIASSVGSAFAPDWRSLLGVRIIGGIGMGIKAVSAPILASETAVGYWRGSTILQWQLWVAFGIMMGLVVNLIIAGAVHGYDFAPNIPGEPEPASWMSQYKALQGILAAPAVPAFLLLIAVCFCYESPRFYMRRGTPNYHPARAYEILLNVRNTKLQALRDMFLIHWSNRVADDVEAVEKSEKQRLTYASRLGMGIRISITQYKTLFSTRRLRNAVYSSCTVNLAQQMCGINILAFYSNELFSKSSGARDQTNEKAAMLYSMGFGAVNFVFCLFAMRSIDTFGRRPWLLTTLPLMSLFLLIAAATIAPWHQGMSDQDPHRISFIVFIFFFAAAYSPGLGPIPFTLASESFPMSHREAGASVAVAINLLFAGLLTIFYPKINTKFTTSGAMGFFSGLNVIAFVLVYLLVEETQRLSLEDLDTIFKRSKLQHMAYQIRTYLPYFIQRHVFLRKVERPQTYYQTIMELDQDREAE